MTRLFTLMLVAFVFAFATPAAINNAAAQSDDAATSATDDAMKGDNGTPGHHTHASPVSENTKTNGTKHTHKHHHKGAKGKHKHHKKAGKGADAGADDAGK